MENRSRMSGMGEGESLTTKGQNEGGFVLFPGFLGGGTTLYQDCDDGHKNSHILKLRDLYQKVRFTVYKFK